MAKRIVLVSTLPCYVAVLVFTLLAGRISQGQGQDTALQLEQAKTSVIALIESGKYEEADADVNRLIADFEPSEAKGQAIYQIAGAYKGAKKYTKAIELWRNAIANQPKAGYAVWCQMEVAWVNIAIGNYNEAQAEVAKLASDYKDDPNLPWTLNIIADHYTWVSKYEQAKEVYQQVIQKDPNNPYAGKARMGIARADALSLIGSKSYTDAQVAVEKMKGDFGDNPDLPEVLYQVAQQFGWERRYDEAKDIYQQIVQRYPSNPYTAKAQKCIQKTGQISNIISSLIESGNYKQAQSAADELIANFGDEPDVPAALYHIASRLEEKQRYAEAKYIYEQIIWRYPVDSQAQRAKVDVRRTKVLSFYCVGDLGGAQAELNAMVTDFNGQPHLPTAVILAAEGVYERARDVNTDEARPHILKTIEILDIVINRIGLSAEVPNALILAGECYERLGQYEQAISAYKRVPTEFPDYDRAGHALFMVGRCYEQLGRTKAIAQTEADAGASQAYKGVVEHYPTSKAARAAKDWLNRSQ